MRTRDFTRVPAPGRAEALVVVERSGGSAAWGRAVRRSGRAADGHVWSTGVRARDAAGAVRGRVVCFATPAQAERWTAALDPARDRWRVFRAEADGYSNGVWRAEGDVMAHVERFSPLSSETARGRTPPLVAPAPARRERPARAAPTGFADGPPAEGITADVPTTPARAGAMFLGATRYRGPHSWLALAREWYPMVATMQRMSGHVWHRVYWEAPFTLGTLAFFTDRDALMLFARIPAHRRLMTWITRDRRHGTGGYIRVHVAATGAKDGTTDGAA